MRHAPPRTCLSAASTLSQLPADLVRRSRRGLHPSKEVELMTEERTRPFFTWTTTRPTGWPSRRSCATPASRPARPPPAATPCAWRPTGRTSSSSTSTCRTSTASRCAGASRPTRPRRPSPCCTCPPSTSASQDKTHGLEGGADGYLTKPVEPEEVVATVHSLLRIHRAEEAARAAARQWQATFDAIHDAAFRFGPRRPRPPLQPGGGGSVPPAARGDRRPALPGPPARDVRRRPRPLLDAPAPAGRTTRRWKCSSAAGGSA